MQKCTAYSQKGSYVYTAVLLLDLALDLLNKETFGKNTFYLLSPSVFVVWERIEP